MYLRIVASFLWSIFLIKYSDFLCAPCFVLSSPSTTPLKTHQHTKTSQTDIGDQLPLSSQMAEVRKGEEETELQATAHLKRNVTPTLQSVPDIMLDTEPLTTQLIETGLEENPFKPELCACLCVEAGWSFTQNISKRIPGLIRKQAKVGKARQQPNTLNKLVIPSFTCESDVSKTGDGRDYSSLTSSLHSARMSL